MPNLCPRGAIFIVLVRKQIHSLPQRKIISLSFKVVCSTDIFENIAQIESYHKLLQRNEIIMEKLSPQKGHTLPFPLLDKEKGWSHLLLVYS